MKQRQMCANRRRRAGAAMLETTLILPLFLIFWFGIIDWGIAFWIHETVVHRANAAVRWQIVNTMCDDLGWVNDKCTSWNETRIKNVFLYGKPQNSGETGLWFSLVMPKIVARPEGKRYQDLRVTMTVSEYQWMHFTPFFATKYYGRPITVSLPAEDLTDGV